MTAFAHLGLADDLLRAIEEKGYTAPSHTRTGHTGHIRRSRCDGGRPDRHRQNRRLHPAPAAIAAAGQKRRQQPLPRPGANPTRELAAQVGESVATYGQHMTMRSAVVYGGVKINPQMMALRKGADVLIATPGRLMDLYQQNAISFSDVEFLVLDEADRMLDMGFIHDIKKSSPFCPPNAKTCSSPPPSPMTSASWPWAFCITRWRSTSARKLYCRDGRSMDPPGGQNPQGRAAQPPITSRDWRQALVFTRTKHGANKLAAFLNKEEIRSSAIHGNKSQAARLKSSRRLQTRPSEYTGGHRYSRPRPGYSRTAPGGEFRPAQCA